MNRHEQCIHDGVDKLHTAAKQIAALTKSDIVSIKMGLHIYNVLVLANSENANSLASADPSEAADDFTWFGLPCEIDREDHNAMPVFMFLEKADRDENTLDIEEAIERTMR